ncbi:7cde55ae-e32c-4cc8-aa10-4265da39da63 [Sclerotinia trifoliorum]|uniref:7cde55ae-e32c-4cc8-aa10-4265da39da63 n=1 Tax=Sclerotinia trifoliorum TaxID=28548 RepID=A0A8H2VQ93_9HELO|nr:7cde55ae-e32c-4cc8-aa10-4265da39da63 [Sclerotinia trifoliorum]
MAKLNNTNPAFKAPVRKTNATNQQSPVEPRKGNGMGKDEIAKKGEEGGTSAKISARKTFGTVTQFNNSDSPRAPVAQMIADMENEEDQDDDSADEILGGRRAGVEEEEDEDDEAGVQNQFQREVALPDSTKSPKKPKSSKKQLARKTAAIQNSEAHQEETAQHGKPREGQQPTPISKGRLGDDMSAEKETSRSRGRPKKSAGSMATPGKETEIIVSSKKYSKTSGRPKASKKIIPAVEQAENEDEDEGQEVGEDENQDEDEDNGDGDDSEGENATEGLTKESFQPRTVRASRIDGEGNEQLLIEWAGYPLQKDWTWESIGRLRESCPDKVKEWENGVQKAAADIQEVEEILDKRTFRGKLQYRVKWDGWQHKHNTWEPAEMLEFDVPYMVEDFEKALKKKAEKKGIARKLGADAELPAAKRRGRPRK